MFVRFVTPSFDAVCQSELGLFHDCFEALDTLDRADWRYREIRSSVDWFNDHLDPPRRFARRLGRHTTRSGICWFRDTARDHITQARHLCWLLSEVDISTAELRARQLGRPVWEDAHQVVTIADQRTPHAFA